MEDLLEILQGLHPEVDFEECETLVDDKILDSFDLVTLVSELSDAFDIEITAKEFIPENFNSVHALYAMVQELQGE